MMDYSRLSLQQKYVVLALAADAYLKDLSVVFHYFGPKTLKNCAKEFRSGGLKEIVLELHNLEDSVCSELDDSFPIFKRTHMISMIKSLRGLLVFGGSKPTGESLLAASGTILGIACPEPYDIDQIGKEFLSVVNAYGYTSYEEFKFDRNAMERMRRFEITDEYLMELVDLLKSACAERILPSLFCGKRLAPVLAASKIKLVSAKEGEPPCYYIYKGGWNGEFCLSEHHRKNKLSAIRTVMHELLPGHHLYSLYREHLFNLGYLGEEATIDLLYSAETPVNEGIAETLPLFLLDAFGDEGIKKSLHIMTAMEHYCKKLLYNVWYHRFVEQKMSEDHAVDYIKEIGNIEDDKIGSWLSFIDAWRIYYPSYPVGITAVKRFMETTQFSGIKQLYLPKSVSALPKLKEYYNMDADERRIYEKNSSETVLSDVNVVN